MAPANIEAGTLLTEMPLPQQFPVQVERYNEPGGEPSVDPFAVGHTARAGEVVLYVHLRQSVYGRLARGGRRERVGSAYLEL